MKKDTYKDRNIQMKYMIVQVEILMKGLEGQPVEISKNKRLRWLIEKKIEKLRLFSVIHLSA